LSHLGFGQVPFQPVAGSDVARLQLLILLQQFSGVQCVAAVALQHVHDLLLYFQIPLDLRNTLPRARGPAGSFFGPCRAALSPQYATGSCRDRTAVGG
jgi:hypothetical protein